MSDRWGSEPGKFPTVHDKEDTLDCSMPLIIECQQILHMYIYKDIANTLDPATGICLHHLAFALYTELGLWLLTFARNLKGISFNCCIFHSTPYLSLVSKSPKSRKCIAIQLKNTNVVARMLWNTVNKTPQCLNFRKLLGLVSRGGLVFYIHIYIYICASGSLIPISIRLTNVCCVLYMVSRGCVIT